MSLLSFDALLKRTRSGKSGEGADDLPTVSREESRALVSALGTLPAADRAQAITRARKLLDTPQSFADRAALEVLRSGIFAEAVSLQPRDAAGWQRLGDGMLKNFSGLPGEVRVIRPAANGGRPVLVFVPRDLDPEKPVRLVTYFHGLHANLGGQPDLARRLREVAPRSQSVFVLPQGWLHTPADAWMDPAAGESFAGLEQAARSAAEQIAGRPLQVSGRTVVAHSNGGFAVANAARTGQLNADRLQLLDCFYEVDGVRVWETLADWAATHKPAQVSVIVATNEQSRIDAFATRLRAVPEIKLELEHPRLGHGALPAKRLAP